MDPGGYIWSHMALETRYRALEVLWRLDIGPWRYSGGYIWTLEAIYGPYQALYGPYQALYGPYPTLYGPTWPYLVGRPVLAVPAVGRCTSGTGRSVLGVRQVHLSEWDGVPKRRVTL